MKGTKGEENQIVNSKNLIDVFLIKLVFFGGIFKEGGQMEG